MSEEMNANILNTKRAAGYLGLRPSTLEAWRCRGGGPVFVKLGKVVRYRRDALDKFLEGQARTSTSRSEKAGSDTGA